MLTTGQTPDTEADKAQLLAANTELRARLEEAEETLRAIRSGEVDALVVEGQSGAQIFTLQGVEAESNQFRGDILEQISDAVVAVDNERHVTYLNVAAERQYGIAVSDALGLSVDELWTSQWPGPADEAAAAAALRDSGRWRGESIHLKRTGERIHVESAVTRLHDAGGTPIGMLATIRDISDRKRIEEALLQNEVLFSTIIEQAPGGVYVVDDKFCVRHVNSQSRAVFAAAEPVIGRDFTEVIQVLWGLELGSSIAAIFRHTLETGERYLSSAFTAPRHDLGVQQSYEWETQRLTLPNGRRGVVCYYTDTTAQRDLEDALRASEQRATGIIQSIADGFITLDAEWGITYLSPRGAEILAPLRKTAENVLGKVFWEEFPATLGTKVEENHRRAMREQVPVQFESFYAPIGRWFDYRVYPSTGGLTIYFLDITDRKRADETLRRSEQALAVQAETLRTADRSKNEFLAMLAHELRNPLAPLRNAAELLTVENVSAGERGQALRMIARQIENMSRMIDDLLDVSRITAGKIELRKKPVALEAILTAATSLARSSCAANGQELTLSLPPEPVFLAADATRLEQVFGNLLNNACKYSGKGTRIAVIAERQRSEIIVRVCDNGAGIAPELLPHIFDLFVQASRTLDRSHGGLGIGLTLVQRLVALHGGTIAAHSKGLGKGAEFIVRLPVLAEAPAAPLPVPLPPQDIPRRILIVDDNTDSAHSLAALQSRRGHETRTAFTGPDAVTAAAEFLPGVVLLDIGLPGMDGFEVARQIRAMPALHGAFLIAMSGYGRDQDRTDAKAAGFDEYIVKPVDLAQLREWLAARTVP